MDVVDASAILMDRPRRPFENLTKTPTPNILESQVDHSKKTKFTAMDVKNLATCRGLPRTEQTPQRGQPRPQKFEDYTYTYSGPDIQPQMQINPVNSNMATTYDQALGVIKDSINTANPLATLNL